MTPWRSALQIDERVLHLALLGDPVGFLARLEVRRDLGIGDFDAFLELVGGERDDGELDLFVALVELGDHVVVGDGDPVGQRALELLEHDAAPDFFFEVARIDRRVLHAQDLGVAGVPDELTVFLEGRDGENPGANLGVACRQPLALRFGQRRFLFDQLLHDALVDAELLEQLLVHAAAIGVAIRLHLLLIDPAESPDGDVAAVDAGDDAVIAGAIEAGILQEAGDVNGYECNNDHRQAPLEPGLVSSHPIEHRHGKRASFRKTGNLDYARVYGRSCCSRLAAGCSLLRRLATAET